MNLAMTAGTVLTDNVNTSETDPKPDVSLTLGPIITGGLDLPLTLSGGQRFTLSMSATYTKSLTGNKDDSFGAPITASLVLPFYIAKWSIVLSDVFNFTNDPLETTFASNRSRVDQYSNTASMNVSKRFGKIGLSLGASRSDQITPDDPLVEQTSYSFFVSPAFFLRENYSVFLRSSYGIFEPADPTRRSSTGFTEEVGVSGQIAQNLSGSISAGYAQSQLASNTVTGAPALTVGGISSTLALSYAKGLRPNTSYTLSFFRSPGITAALQSSDITEVSGVNLAVTHRLNNRVTVTPIVGWVHLEDVSGDAGETADIVSVGISFVRFFTRHLTGTLGYTYQTRMSNISGSSYEVNRIGVNLTYNF